MKFSLPIFTVMGVLVATASAQKTLRYDFNDFKVGPIDGQMEWNVYDKVKDSSAFSIMNELGTSEAVGDKALVIQASGTPIRCVTGEPLRWLPGRELAMEFDFKVAVHPKTFTNNKPTLGVMVGNSLLSEKARFSIGLEALPSGDWVLVGAMPDRGSRKIYSENFLFRSEKSVSISEWYQFELVLKKLTEPDTFQASVKIKNAKTGAVVTEMRFSSEDKGKVSRSMWDTSRAHVGFYAPKDLLGLVCVDNLVISSSK